MRCCVAILETASICYCVKHKRNFQQLKREICAGLEIIFQLAPVKLSGQTYFCSDTTHSLRHISIKSPHPHDVYI